MARTFAFSSLDSSSFRLSVFGTLAVCFGLGASACGGSDPGGDGDGDGDGAGTGGAGTGGIVGDGDGDLTGTGGEAATPTRVPGTTLYNCDPQEGAVPGLGFTEVVGGFDRSILVTHAPDDAARLFVVEQPGVIQIVKGNSKNPAPFLDIQDRVRTDGGWEQGLLGLAFHPDFATNGLFYVHYTAEDSHAVAEAADGVIAEFQVTANPDVADPNSERFVFRSDHPMDSGEANTYPYWGNHNGGQIAFGPDKMLYIALGDGGGGGDHFGNGQNTATVLGTITRIDPAASGSASYGIPPGNLSETVPGAAPEVWDYGLRNPYRMNFDGCTGDLYIGDVGDGSWEEVNIEPAGSGHNNYGWPIMEGDACFNAATCDMSGLRAPFSTFNTMGSSITGGAVYRGSEIPALRGRYFYGEHTGGRFFSLTYDGSTDMASAATDLTSQVGTAGWGISSIQNSANGEIYMTTMDTLYKLTAL